MTEKVLLRSAFAPNLPDGHRAALWEQNVYVPDPREPGRVRRARITFEMCVRLLPDEVEVMVDPPTGGDK